MTDYESLSIQNCQKLKKQTHLENVSLWHFYFRAAKIMGKSGPVITMEVIKRAVFYHGLSKLIEEDSKGKTSNLLNIWGIYDNINSILANAPILCPLETPEKLRWCKIYCLIINFPWISLEPVWYPGKTLGHVWRFDLLVSVFVYNYVRKDNKKLHVAAVYGRQWRTQDLRKYLRRRAL